MGRRARHGREWLAVAGAFAILVVVTGVWLARDRRPPPWDYANHLERAIHCAQDLAGGDLRRLVERSSFYPPLVPCLAGVVYLVAPSDHAFAQAVILGFLGLGMAATYVVARRWAAGPGAVVAAIVFGTAPFAIHLMPQFQLDLPLAAMVAAFLASLLAADRFRRPAWGVLCGVLFGLGMLTKPPFAAYVLPPLLLVLAGTRGRAAWLTALTAGALALVVALPWYGPRLIGLPAQVSARSFRQAEEAGFPDPLSAAGLAYYPLHLAQHMGVVGALLMIVGVVVALRWRFGFVLAGLVPFLGLLAIRNKQLRYTLPLLPMAAVAAGLGFSALPRSLRWGAGLVVLAVAAVQVSSGAFGRPAELWLPIGPGVPLTVSVPPAPADWRHREILARITRDAGRERARVSVVPNYPWFSAANFRYYAVRDDLPVVVSRAWDGEPVGVDYMILKSGDLGPAYTIAKARQVMERLAADRYLAEAFPPIGELPLPDGSTATVRARRLPRVEAEPSQIARAAEMAFRRRLESFAVDVRDLTVALDHDRGIQSGRIRQLRVSAAAATVGDFARAETARIRLHDVRAVLDAVVINPASALGERRFDVLDLGVLRVEAVRVDAGAFQEFLRQSKAGRRTSVRFGPGFAEVGVAMPGPDIQARITLRPAADRPFAVQATAVRVGGVGVPDILVDWVMRNVDPSGRIARRLPFRVELATIELRPDGMTVGRP
jgi:hypothetical protein